MIIRYYCLHYATSPPEFIHIRCWNNAEACAPYIALHIFYFIRVSTYIATCLIHIPNLFPFSSVFLSLSPVTSLFTARVTPHENVTAGILSYAVSHLHAGTGKLRKTCIDTVGHLTESVRSLTISEKWPPAQDGRSPSNYWPSEKLLDLGDRRATDTYHTPNTVGFALYIFEDRYL